LKKDMWNTEIISLLHKDIDKLMAILQTVTNIWRNLLPPSNPEDGSSRFTHNVGTYFQFYMVSCPRRP